MADLLKFLGVAGLAAVDLFLAIPAGIASGYGFWSLFLAMAIGGTVGGVLAAVIGDTAQRWWRANRTVRSRPKPSGWITQVAERWGAPGLGLLSPVLVGTPAGAMIGIGLGLERRELLSWLTVGTIGWSAVFAGLTAGGVATVS